jgi:hypothetical protein
VGRHGKPTPRLRLAAISLELIDKVALVSDRRNQASSESA